MRQISLLLISLHTTINIIKDYKLVEKRKIQLPDSIVGIFKCPNLRCVSNSEEGINPTIDIIKKENIILRCRYWNKDIDYWRASFLIIQLIVNW